MDKNKELEKLVIEENIRFHAKEAPYYKILNPQVFNWYHNRKVNNDITFIISMFKNKDKIDVLDLGCGTGFLTKKLISFPNVFVTAVDLSKEMLSELEKDIFPEYTSRVILINQEANSFLKGNPLQYDLITASALLHHIVEIREFIDLALKNLKSGGILYFAFEPLKQMIDNKIRYMIHRGIRFIDISIFKLYLKLLKINISDSNERNLANYQVIMGGIDPNELNLYLKDKGKTIRFEKFAVRANGFLAFISDKIVKSQNTFSIIFRKL